MIPENKEFIAQIPKLDLSEGTEMLNDFSREAQRHLISARNSLLILETASSDKESIENVFKTFHTIKGLADFLKLHDIYWLTGKVETMIDMIRKDFLPLEAQTIQLINDAMKSLQKLLELLDEQIADDGKLESPYHDVGPLVTAIQTVIDKKASTPMPAKPIPRALKTIVYEPDMLVFQKIEDQIKGSDENVKVDKALLKKLLTDFQEVTRELKDTQGKLHERQRELIKERELAIKLTQQAQSEARTKSEYLANMSHEIRTLINAILGFTAILRESNLTDKQRDHLQTIIVSGKMLLEIVNDILDFSKVEAGKLKLENIDFNLNHITEEVFKILRSRIANKPIHLYFEIADDVPAALKGDPTRVKQVFMNLLDNGIKFTEKGEIGMSVSRNAEETQQDGIVWLKFIVKDSGIGIPANRIPLLFQSFTQANESTTRLYGGTGLGLSLCKTFIEKMGGRIDVRSELGKGTMFIFSIPFEIGKPIKEDLNETIPTGLDIMVISSHEKTLQAFSTVAKKQGVASVTSATTAKQATELLLKRESDGQPLPSIMFIDTMLSGKEGFMLAYKIRQQERYHEIHLVAVTSDGRVEITDDFQQAGFQSSMMKPIIRQELAETIARVLSEKPTDHRVISPTVLQKISCAGVRVLVVEDSVPNQELLKIHLESLECVAEYAANGKEAIDLLKKNKYDICLMDLQMPVMGGIEASRIIRFEMKLPIPIIALTAAEIQEEREKCFAAGMNSYLAKPFGLDDLKEVIIKCTKM